jgi:hypothetical protein
MVGSGVLNPDLSKGKKGGAYAGAQILPTGTDPAAGLRPKLATNLASIFSKCASFRTIVSHFNDVARIPILLSSRKLTGISQTKVDLVVRGLARLS